MNTRFDLVIPGIYDSVGDAVFNKIRTIVLKLEKKINLFDQESSIHFINENAYRISVSLDEDLWELLLYCKKYNTLTNGYFDISILPLIEFWKTYNPNLFLQNDFNYIKNNLGFQHIELDSKQKSIRFANSIIKIDLGAVGKGFAIEKIIPILKDYDVKNAFISFGDSSISAIGNHPSGKGWKIGIPHLLEKENFVHEYHLEDQSCSISGITPENRTKGNKQFGHIIHPQTGFPHKSFQTVSVVSSSPVEAECLSTAYLAADNKNKWIIKNHFPHCLINDYSYSEDIAHHQHVKERL